MSAYVPVGSLQVAEGFRDFIDSEALAGTGIEAAQFWPGLAALIADLTPTNTALLAERDRLQSAIDGWHQSHRDTPHDNEAYRAFLVEIGYLVAEPPQFQIQTDNVDAEIASIAGPQLVVPVLNARFVLNAANARWVSLYDALYGTDAISEDHGAERGAHYNPTRGRRVVAFARRFLDDIAPLEQGSHSDATGYAISGGELVITTSAGVTSLQQPALVAGYTGAEQAPDSVLLVHHGLHVSIVIDRNSPIGSDDGAGVNDVIVEAAITTIVDFEDSVAAVDAHDKVAAYRNWLALNRGDLAEQVTKGGKTITRTLNPDPVFTDPAGTQFALPGRALLFARNVGHLMRTDAILDAAGDEVYEGILDAVVTTLAALPGLDPHGPRRNGRTGSIYIVKPKMHGPAEVAFTVQLFRRVEQLLGLAPNTVKLGVMDEERRTTLNLAAAVYEARERIVFINTGFLDRSGDEIHTSFEAGAIVAKADLKRQPWITAYEDHNVDVGLAAGFAGRGQIGKGMWAMPELMHDMMEQKIAHPKAGASTAWVPSPTAAALHALHYHQVNVAQVQQALAGTRQTGIEDILRIPLGDPSTWSEASRSREIDNNVQSILGYVVRWIDQGIGCSKVPDIDNIDLMEDRATLRISSQLMANWLRHGVVSERDVRASLAHMAAVVDAQNAGDPNYQAMSTDLDGSIAFQAATDLIFLGAVQPNGYTEPILHRRRREAKNRAGSLLRTRI